MLKLKHCLLSIISAKSIARLTKRGEELLTREYDETSSLYDSIESVYQSGDFGNTLERIKNCFGVFCILRA